MLADIIFTILMLILPVVLCIVPKTRRNNGNWLIALKTVPLGLIAAGWSGELLLKIAPIISERQERDFSFPFSLHLAVMLTAVSIPLVLLLMLSTMMATSQLLRLLSLLQRLKVSMQKLLSTFQKMQLYPILQKLIIKIKIIR